MTMGLSMALFEETLIDAALGGYVNHDLAGYHVPTNADIGEIEVEWIDEEDPREPDGGEGHRRDRHRRHRRGRGERGLHATGVRFRDLPITPARILG